MLPLGLETGSAYHTIYAIDLPPKKCGGTCKGSIELR